MEKTLESMVITAVAPWNSPYREEKSGSNTESQQNIDFCLNHCPYADSECCNCLSGGKPKAGRPGKIDLDQLAEMLTLKRTSKEICQAFGVTKMAVSLAKKKLNERRAGGQDKRDE